MAPSVRVAVLGPWEKRSDLVAAVRNQSEGFVVAGKLLKRVGSKDEVVLQQVDPDPALASSCQQAGGFTPPELTGISTHKRVLWLEQPAGVRQAWELLDASAGLVRAGGLAVHVPSAGKWVPPALWLQLAGYGESLESIYSAYVSMGYTLDGRSYFASGMHALGAPDALVPTELSAAAAGELLNAFLIHVLRGYQPREEEGYQAHAEAPRYGLRRELCSHFPVGHPQHNPQGLWRLS